MTFFDDDDDLSLVVFTVGSFVLALVVGSVGHDSRHRLLLLPGRPEMFLEEHNQFVDVPVASLRGQLRLAQRGALATAGIARRAWRRVASLPSQVARPRGRARRPAGRGREDTSEAEADDAGLAHGSDGRVVETRFGDQPPQGHGSLANSPSLTKLALENGPQGSLGPEDVLQLLELQLFVGDLRRELVQLGDVDGAGSFARSHGRQDVDDDFGSVRRRGRCGVGVVEDGLAKAPKAVGGDLRLVSELLDDAGRVDEAGDGSAKIVNLE